MSVETQEISLEIKNITIDGESIFTILFWNELIKNEEQD